MTHAQRESIIKFRKLQGQPWHAPPHGLEKNWYHISAACYEHKPVIGKEPDRMAAFEAALLTVLRHSCNKVSAWCVLPNHYHCLVQCVSISMCRHELGLLHGRTSREWNKEDNAAGRKCWHRCLPKEIKSERHRWATVNYIHNNPVHHEYVRLWQEWLFSSAQHYLDAVGRETAEKIWREFPVLDIGKGWDDDPRMLVD